MRTILIVAGFAWFILALLMLLSLARAARRRMPWPALAAVTPRCLDACGIANSEPAPDSSSDNALNENNDPEQRQLI